MPDTPKAQTPDPQFGIVSIMRPFSGFAAVYEGITVTSPIMFTEGGVALDAAAGSPGYSPSLVKGWPVPLGARVALWLPDVSYVPVAFGASFPYTWSIIWRMRNTFDYRTQRLSFHYPKQGAGIPDTSVVPTASRVVIPAASQGIVYVQAEPSGLTRAAQDLRSVDTVVASSTIGAPLLPSGAVGFIQQGILDPGVTSQAKRPLYVTFDVTALGDELLIAVTRSATTVANWTFGSVDLDFSKLFGIGLGAAHPDIGAYAMIGVAP